MVKPNQVNNQNQTNQTTENENQTLDLNSIWSWDLEDDSWKGHYTQAKYADSKKPIPWPHPKSIDRIRYENFLAAVTNPMDEIDPTPTERAQVDA